MNKKTHTLKKAFVLTVVLLLCIHVSSMLTMSCANAAIANARVDEILQAIAENPDETRFSFEDYSFYPGESRDGLIIGYLSESGKGCYGVIDTERKTAVIPFEYRDIFFIPDGNMFIIEKYDGKEYGPYYVADRYGKMNRIDIEGNVLAVDTEGYVTLFKDEEVDCIETELGGTGRIGVPKMALLDNEYNMVLDYVLDGVFYTPVSFKDDMAVVQTGATQWYHGTHFSENNGKYEVIDRKGRTIIAPEYDKITYLGDNKFTVQINSTTESIESTVDVSDILKKYAIEDSFTEYGTSLVNMDLLAGMGGDDNLRIGSDVTREQAIAMILSFSDETAEARKLTDAQTESVLSKYSDNAKISTWARSFVAYATQKGYVGGRTDGTYDPAGSVKGSEFGIMLLNAMGFAPADDYTPAESAAFLTALGQYNNSSDECEHLIALNNAAITRGDCMAFMYGALGAKRRDTGITQLNTLIEKGRLTENITLQHYHAKIDATLP